jgi:hypothetical protein
MANKRTALITKIQFSSFGKTFLPNDEVVSEDAEGWPEGTLEKRVANGFIVPTVIEVAEEAASPEPTQQSEEASLLENAAAKISKKSKE